MLLCYRISKNFVNVAYLECEENSEGHTSLPYFANFVTTDLESVYLDLLQEKKDPHQLWLSKSTFWFHCLSNVENMLRIFCVIASFHSLIGKNNVF